MHPMAPADNADDSDEDEEELDEAESAQLFLGGILASVGPFSAVSARIFGNKCSLFSIFEIYEVKNLFQLI